MSDQGIVMKFMSSIIALAMLVAILPAQAQQRPYKEGQAPAGVQPLAVGDPLKIIYRISGVTDNGGGDAVGVATLIHCTNFGSVSETVKFIIKQWDGTVLKSRYTTIVSGNTRTAATHYTALFFEDLALTPNIVIGQGSAIIYATLPQMVFCSAMIVDAAATVPQGISLHMVRYNPATGTQE